jgi:hypothetical protein
MIDNNVFLISPFMVLPLTPTITTSVGYSYSDRDLNIDNDDVNNIDNNDLHNNIVWLQAKVTY